MGTFINIGNIAFSEARNGEYVDKSGMIAVVNGLLNTEQRYLCTSRSRRFGKSMAAKMLAAYYDRSCDSHEVFADLEIAKDASFEKHINKYDVLYVDLSKLVTMFKNDEDIVAKIQQVVIDDVLMAYPDTEVKPYYGLSDVLLRITEKTGVKFFLIIDEWDAICREFSPASKAMDTYVDWLRSMFKDVNSSRIFSGVYVTGILPIKKYNTQSALNNFEEYSMIDSGDMGSFFGFTREEVKALCEKYGRDYEEMEKWYDGYRIGDVDGIFNPNSVIMSLRRRRCSSFWAKTASYESVAAYIEMNYEGLKDDIIAMLGGGRCHVDTTRFGNNMHEVKSKDDVLTVLIHLGYLTYDIDTEECFIPNFEVRKEMENAVEANNWRVMDTINNSKKLLQSTLEGDEEMVASCIEQAHDENTSVLSYNDENSLSCVLTLSYIYARNSYIFHRELASGKGFADIVLIPRKNVDGPAVVLELKVNKDADTAISQIHRKQYTGKVSEYTGNVLLVGINYDKQSKTHTCKIERMQKV